MFSVETIITIGYGAGGNDIFFDSCVSVAVVISFESVIGILSQALGIGLILISLNLILNNLTPIILLRLIWARLARGQTRAEGVIFADKAVIRQIRGKFFFMFQVVELRKHQLTQAHVRAYTFQRKTEPGDVKPWFETHNMRISRPDDSNGAWMLMALPCLVSHGIDEWSPLWPPAFNKPNGLVKLSTLYPNIALRDDLVYGVGGGS